MLRLGAKNIGESPCGLSGRVCTGRKLEWPSLGRMGSSDPSAAMSWSILLPVCPGQGWPRGNSSQGSVDISPGSMCAPGAEAEPALLRAPPGRVDPSVVTEPFWRAEPEHWLGGKTLFGGAEHWLGGQPSFLGG